MEELQVEEAGAVLSAGENAGFGTAEDAVTAAGDGVVDRIAKEPGQELQKECGGTRETSELMKDEEDGVGAGE